MLLEERGRSHERDEQRNVCQSILTFVTLTRQSLFFLTKRRVSVTSVTASFGHSAANAAPTCHRFVCGVGPRCVLCALRDFNRDLGSGIRDPSLRFAGQSCRTAAAVRLARRSAEREGGSAPTHECRKARAAIHRVDFLPRVRVAANQLQRFVPWDGCRVELANSRRAIVSVGASAISRRAACHAEASREGG